MTTHLTARIAWHDDGWNGRVCSQPERNTYCVGMKSFPGDVIHRERDLEREKACAGQALCKLKDEDLRKHPAWAAAGLFWRAALDFD